MELTRYALAGYIGGAGRENGIDVAVDGAGAAYVSGSTGSADFPATGPDTSFNGAEDDTDAFVAKVNPSGTGLDYATYVGGSGGEQGNNVAVDGAGNAYLTGFTTSDETEFPDGDGFGGANAVTGFDTTFNSPFTGAPDAFVAKVNATGTAFGYAGYIGGGGGEAGTAIAVDGAGNAYVSGPTSSNERPPGLPAPPPVGNIAGGFPDGDGGTVVGPDLTYNDTSGPPPAPGDGFVAKVNSAGTALDYAGYIGGSAGGEPGSGNDKPFGIAVDAAGSAYVTGETTSREASFPNGQGFGSLPGFDQTYNGGSDVLPAAGPTFLGDAFVAKVTPSGDGFSYATYFGGSGDEGAISIEVDGAGAAHIAGTTRSTDFPVKDGPDLSYAGQGDAFVAKLNPAGTGSEFAGYIGGSLSEAGIGVAVDSAGNVYTAGSTDSDQCRGFPVTAGPDPAFNGPFASSDAFVAKIAPAGSASGALLDRPPGCAGGGPGGGTGGEPPPSAGCPAGTSAGVSCVRNSAGGLDITGTSAAERIVGSSGRDVIGCGDGDDVVFGGAGNDTVRCGAGNDRVNGGLGRDVLLGESGNDSVGGDPGDDRLLGGSGNDRISGGSGSDAASGGIGSDRIAGNEGRDRLHGNSGNDRISGNEGNDIISGNNASDRLAGDSGNDRISGGRTGNDRLVGGSGNDRLSGGIGRDRLVAGVGRDRLSGGRGSDRLNTRDRRGRDRADCGESRRDRDRASVDRGDRVRGCERVRRRR